MYCNKRYRNLHHTWSTVMLKLEIKKGRPLGGFFIPLYHRPPQMIRLPSGGLCMIQLWAERASCAHQNFTSCSLHFGRNSSVKLAIFQIQTHFRRRNNNTFPLETSRFSEAYIQTLRVTWCSIVVPRPFLPYLYSVQWIREPPPSSTAAEQPLVPRGMPARFP